MGPPGLRPRTRWALDAEQSGLQKDARCVRCQFVQLLISFELLFKFFDVFTHLILPGQLNVHTRKQKKL